MFVAILLVIGAGLFGAAAPWGASVFAAGLVALALWLARCDIARRTVRTAGLTRYIAVCLLSGYVWLAAGGAVILAAGGLVPGSRAYDVGVHALGLGFVFSMVFGHAPVIVPAVLRVAVPYQAAFYAPLLLLHASLARAHRRGHGDATRLGAGGRAGERARARALHRDGREPRSGGAGGPRGARCDEAAGACRPSGGSAVQRLVLRHQLFRGLLEVRVLHDAVGRAHELALGLVLGAHAFGAARGSMT